MVCHSNLEERQGIVTFKGNPLTLLGPEPAVGMDAPDFTLLAGDLSAVQLSNYVGRKVLISVVPSIDTGVCDMQTRRFNEEASSLGDVAVLTVSADLPFAQARWCGAAGVDNLTMLSDHRDVGFGSAYGVLISELRLLARAIFVIGADRKIQYLEIVPEMTDHPDYDAALAAVKSA